MDSIELINYLIWADNLTFDLIANTEETLVKTIFYKNAGSMRDRLQHLAEEYLAWFYDMKGENYMEEIKKMENMTEVELIKSIKQYHKNYSEFIKSPKKTEFEIDEGKDLIVKISLNEVIYNLVNHANYHRGQIHTLLRMAGVKVPKTDYYWYKISKLRT